MPSPTPLYQIEECPDLYVDACVCDEQRNLVFLSAWGRDTVTQELLARLWAGKRVARQNFSGQTPKNLSFTPRARVGRDSRFTNTVITGDGFQSTRPCGARRDMQIRARVQLWFQSTRPCGARPAASTPSIAGSEFQSTRPCGARHAAQAGLAGAGGVSIHAPVRGATLRTQRRLSRSAVSIHAPVRGATQVADLPPLMAKFQSTRPCGARPSLPPNATMGTQFQSTRPCGARLFGRLVVSATLAVSIHAPVRGATALL